MTTGTLYYSATGDHVETSPNGTTWSVLTDPPVVAGHSWSNGAAGLTCQWSSAGDVTVPAGTFHDCWTATCTSAFETDHTTYCRGTGFVSGDTGGGNSKSSTQLTGVSG